jgi:ferredoxin
MKIVVDREKCRASGECVTACPEDAISIVDGAAAIDESSYDERKKLSN